jgi:hypothetical protein
VGGQYPYGDRVAVGRGRKEGEAFIEVVADTSRYERDLERSIDRATKAAAREETFQALTKAMGDAGERAGENYETRFLRALHRHEPNLIHDVSQIGALAGSGFVDLFSGEVFRRGAGLFGEGGKITEFFSFFAKGLGILGEAVLSPGFLAGLGSFLITAGILVVVVPLLTSAVFALGGALVSLVGILGAIPALGFGLLATLVPLLIAFQGIGDAVSALVSGDMDKFNESLKKLTPSAAGVLREFKSLMPVFSTIRKSVQEAFFGQISGDLTRLIKAIDGPLLAGLSNVAFALGGFVSQLLQFAATPKFVTFIADLFSHVADGINRGGPVLIRFFDAMVSVAEASLPAVSALFDRLGQGLDSFSAFLQQSVADGSFQEFLDSAFVTLGDIGDVISELIGLFKDMFATTDEAGQRFLEDVADAIKQLREFFQSPDGKEFIENMITLAHDFGIILIWVAEQVAGLIHLFAKAIEAFDDAGDAMERFFNRTKAFGGNPLIGFVAGFLPGLARGGITDGPTIAGEAGDEAVIPLDDPSRARQVASDPRVADILGEPSMTVYAIFDGEPFQARIVKTVRGAQRETARKLGQQPRSVGVG